MRFTVVSGRGGQARGLSDGDQLDAVSRHPAAHVPAAGGAAVDGVQGLACAFTVRLRPHPATVQIPGGQVRALSLWWPRAPWQGSAMCAFERGGRKARSLWCTVHEGAQASQSRLRALACCPAAVPTLHWLWSSLVATHSMYYRFVRLHNVSADANPSIEMLF